MNAILIMKGLSVIGIVLCVIMMIWKQGQLAKTPEGKANIEWGLKPNRFICTIFFSFQTYKVS